MSGTAGFIKGLKMPKDFFAKTRSCRLVSAAFKRNYEELQAQKKARGDKVDHRGRVFTYVPAQMASPGPPLGSQLGQIGVNIANFVKDFNLKTSIFKEGVPIPCYITIKPDRTHNLVMAHPPFSYLIKQAAGIQRGAMKYSQEVAGKITRKHVYEIAKLKSQDEMWQQVDLRKICVKVIDEAYTMGVIVVDHLDPDEYAEFLVERKEIIERQRAEIQEARDAKLLRVAKEAASAQ